MTVCNPSLATKPIPTCIENLSIGSIPDNNQAVFVIIEDITTGRREKYSATSDGSGIVIVDVSAAEFSDTHGYQGWIYKSTDGIGDPYTITIGASTTEYFGLTFEKVFDDGELLYATSVTLEVA